MGEKRARLLEGSIRYRCPGGRSEPACELSTGAFGLFPVTKCRVPHPSRSLRRVGYRRPPLKHVQGYKEVALRGISPAIAALEKSKGKNLPSRTSLPEGQTDRCSSCLWLCRIVFGPAGSLHPIPQCRNNRCMPARPSKGSGLSREVLPSTAGPGNRYS
jgi:hypothetical protein